MTLRIALASIVSGALLLVVNVVGVVSPDGRYIAIAERPGGYYADQTKRLNDGDTLERQQNESIDAYAVRLTEMVGAHMMHYWRGEVSNPDNVKRVCRSPRTG